MGGLARPEVAMGFPEKHQAWLRQGRRKLQPTVAIFGAGQVFVEASWEEEVDLWVEELGAMAWEEFGQLQEGSRTDIRRDGMQGLIY